MKFDKFMNICYRILCLITGIVVLLGFCVSCFGSPLKAKAFSPADPTTWATLVDEWRDEYENNLTSTLQQINQGLANGDIDASTDAGKRFLAVQALQALALSNPSMGTILHAVDLGLQTVPDFSAIEDLPDSFTVSGSSFSGLYSDLSGDVKTISVMPVTDGTIIFGDGFSFIIGFTDDNYVSRSASCSSSVSGNRVTLTFSTDYNGRVFLDPVPSGSINGTAVTVPSRSYWISSESWLSKWGTFSRSFAFSTNSIPVYSSHSAYDFTYFLAGSPNTIMGYGQHIVLPSETIDTQTPWNYYNNTILPYIQQNYPEITNNYLVFPNGWYPSIPDPTEPPTFPNGGIYIDKQYNIGINIIYPTDASGQPITDASGETVTETQYIIDTSPLDGEYNFQMPTLAKLNMYDATLPNPDISAFSDGISWIWNVCYNILTESGFMPVVMIVFALALFGFILWKLGG